jgi:DNA repair exonuclease SbcCD ATPase subunit/DNA repair exonuclease SbcCD nuclease subunit
MKFAHIADTHIKNLKYHYEYRKVFDRMYEILREEDVDCIVHCGDIAHTKTQISPEFVEMCSKFFRNLAEIAPTYIILGNHDGNLKNSSRQDAITPIVEALDLDSIHLLKDSGEIELNDKFCLNVLSVFDQDNWVAPSDPDKINIALYHGSIAGVQTDAGWVMDHGDHDVSIFENHDFAFLGDIHKTNQVLDYEGRVRYAGSTVQQNHGETNDKGFLVWDIEDKDTFDCSHRILENPKPFITIELTPRGRMPRGIKIPDGARVRLVSNNALSLNAMRKAVDVAKRRFRPESITFLNRAAGERGSIDDLADGFKIEDLRDSGIQEKLIREYLSDYETTDEVLETILKLNLKYNALVEEGEEVLRNVNWKLATLQWDNLFNYGEDNKINFTDLSGVVGVFGKNFSGKSSIIDSFLYTVYNSTSKNVRKNLNVINQTKDFCSGKVSIVVGNKTYTIDRKSEKYTKRLKGNETVEAKTDLNFECYDKVMDETSVLNGTTRNETDRNIRRLFGTLDDFLLTSMASQLGSLMFISEGSTRRKEILAKFLDLEIFEKKYKLAKEDAADIKGALKRLEGREFDDEIVEAMKVVFDNENVTELKKRECEEIKENLQSMIADQSNIELAIAAIPAEMIDIKQIENDLVEANVNLDQIITANKDRAKELKQNKELLERITGFLGMLDYDALNKNSEEISNYRDELSDIISEVESTERLLARQETKVELLKQVPCGDKYPTCKFLQDAHEAFGSMPETKQELIQLRSSRGTLDEKIENLNPDQTDRHLEKYDRVLEKKKDIENMIPSAHMEIERNDSQIAHLKLVVENLIVKAEEYEENRETIENLEALLTEKDNLISTIESVTNNLDACEVEILELYKSHGSLQQKVENLKDQKKDLVDLREEYTAYDLYMQCMHSNGIAYDIIKKKLPVINNEVAKVLANVVDFEVFFESDDKKLNIFIKHPKYDARPLEMGSGAEKTIAAMAIRLALLNISSLPKPDVFILDEPGTALDAENMEGFIRILEIVKTYFKTVLLISHLDTLKDCADVQIVIDKKEGFAHVNQ